MELIFKLPPDKLPFIGIRYPESETRKAQVTNRDYVDLKDETEFEINIYMDKKCTLELICSSPRSQYMYKDLDVIEHKLKAFRNYININNCEQFNFGHVVKKFDHDKLVQTQPKMKNFVLKIQKLNFIVQENTFD